MKKQVLPPGVQNAQKANLCAEMCRVRRHLQQRPCAGPEQQAVEHRRVLLAKRLECVRQGEDDVEVGHAKHFLFSRGEPALARLRLTFWTVPITARVIRDSRLITARTNINVAPQSRRATATDRSQHAELLKAQPGSIPLHKTVALRMDEIGHLEDGPAHTGLCRLRERSMRAALDTAS